MRPDFVLPLLLALLWTPCGHAAPQLPDPALKARLVQALAGSGGFSDRYDAEVWITDMSGRLARHLQEPQRRLQLLRHVHRESMGAGLPPELVLAVIDVESRFDRFAISSAGARGLMQVMPFWLAELGREEDNLFNVETNLRFGCTILRYYLDLEGGNVERALARYNGSLGSRRYPQRVMKAYRSRWSSDIRPLAGGQSTTDQLR